MTNPMFRIYSLLYEKFLLAQGPVIVFCTKFNVQIGAGRHISHPCQYEGVWPNSLVRRPSWLYASSVKNKTRANCPKMIYCAHTCIRSDRHLGQFPRTRPVLFVTLWNFLVPYIQSMHLHLSGFAKSSLSLYVKVKSAFNTCHSTYLSPHFVQLCLNN